MDDKKDIEIGVDYLKFRTAKGFRKLITGVVDDSLLPTYRARIYSETEDIVNSGFVDYFLIVLDCLAWCSEQGIYTGPGRGSVGGSLVAYVLGITKVDPIKYGLIWERFFNVGRKDSPPDIDMDIEDARRHEVIDYLKERYGDDCVCSITTFGRLAMRSTVRDVARSLKIGGSSSESHRLAGEICAHLPKLSGGQSFKDVVAASADLKKYQEEYPDLFKYSEDLYGLIRQSGIHACGIVIAPEPIINTTPMKIQKGEVAIELELDRLESRRFMKFDFLGLSNLTIIKNAIANIKRTKGEVIILDSIPLDDRATYRLIGDGNTLGVFQMESYGMRKYTTHIKPRSIKDIALCISVYRPGALDSGAADRVVQIRSMGRTPSYLHPDLEPILKDSYSQLIYQESAMQIARKFAGFSLQEADTLRKAIGKKKIDIMAKVKTKFIDGCVAQGYESSLGEKLFADIEGFANYGFNLSHAVGYAHISYWTAYLKTNYTAEYFCALLSHSDIEKIPEYIANAEEMGVEVLPPDVNLSGKDFYVTDDGKIRRSLMMIKGIGESVVDSVLSNRPYSNFKEFCYKKAVSQSVALKLIKAGAFDSFAINRGVLYANMGNIYGIIKSGYKQGDVQSEREARLAKAICKYELGIEVPTKEDVKTNTDRAREILSIGYEGREELSKKILSAIKRVSKWSPNIVEDSLRTYEMQDICQWTIRQIWEGELETCGQFISSSPLGAQFVREYVSKLSKIPTDISGLEDVDHGDNTTVIAYVLEETDRRTISGGKILTRYKVIDNTGSTELTVFSKKTDVPNFETHDIIHAKIRVYSPPGQSFRSYNISSIIKILK